MGKKKNSAKKQKDGRGYSQGAPPALSKMKSPSVSAKTHADMKGLLNQIGSVEVSEKPETSTMNQPSDRFASRLSNVVDRLDELGFTNDQVEQVVTSLQYEITLDSALDWLCLNLTTLELPSLFTDGKLRENLSTVTTAESLTVVKESAPATCKSDVQVSNFLVTSESSKTNTQIKRNDEKLKQEETDRKNWLLKQYEYEDVSDVDEEDLTNGFETAEEQLTPEEQHLADEEKRLRELEADLSNDANNYMRSKQEIKALQNEVKKLRQQINGLRKKVEGMRAKREKEAKAEKEQISATDIANESDDDQEESGGGFFDLFGEAQDSDDMQTLDTNTANVANTNTTKIVSLLDYPIPKGWTGTTPGKKLDEMCKKQKLPKPKYTKLEMNEGYRLSVSISKKNQVWEARNSDFQTGSSLKDYLATKALYSIDSTLPLYQLFPTSFRDLWLSWVNEQNEVQDQAKQQIEKEKQLRIDHLLSIIKTQNKGKENDSIGASETKKNTDKGTGNQKCLSMRDLCEETKMSNAKIGVKMRENFIRRQSTVAYKEMKAIRDTLPMMAFKQEILDKIKSNPVTILCAETGAGKTTQCGQFILEQALLEDKGAEIKILCTQPRRVAATSVAERVSEELCEPLGKMVGFQIRMEAKRSEQTKLLFCTTGVVLRQLQDDPFLNGITHVLVDEVHERQQQTDCLLIILRQLLKTTRPDLKVVLMSATLDSKLFCSFFHGAPLINVPGRTFPVASYYLEDLLDATDHVIEEGSRYAVRDQYYGEKTSTSMWVTGKGGEKHREVVDLVSQVDVGVSQDYNGYKMSTRRSMDRVNEEVINYDLIEDVLLVIVRRDTNTTLLPPNGSYLDGSILVFFPGFGEIKSMMDRLEGHRIFGDKSRFDIIPMHSTLSSQDQRKAFIPGKRGRQKIILSTNIAETSITIPDCTCVIDTGRIREVRRNKRTSTSLLVTDWCSKASAKQRAGRAGRVQSGMCLKLYSSFTGNKIMKPASEPELRRVPLEEVCMAILASGFTNSCMDFLMMAPQPPDEESIKSAIDVLNEVGAIDKSDTANTDSGQSEYLTVLGRHLARLPLDIRLGKMLIYGALFRCTDEILTIAASLSSSQSPFSTFLSDAAVAKAKQKRFADPDSDFSTYVNVWEVYSTAATKSHSAGRIFCRENFLNHVAMREIGEARKQYFDLLCDIGFVDRQKVIADAPRSNSRMDATKLKTSIFNQNAGNRDLLHLVICAGFYPNVARLDQPQSCLWHKDEKLYFHNSSVNSGKKKFKPNSEVWVVFHEKFGTPTRTSISTTCFVHPFALLLLGGSVVVKHTDRLVVVDEWMNIGMAAQTGVILGKLKKNIHYLLQKLIGRSEWNEINVMESTMIDGLINILSSQ